MLLRKTLYIISIVYFIQEIQGRPQQSSTKPSPVQEAIQQIDPELIKITMRLDQLKLNLHTTILQSFQEAHTYISNFGANILEAINQLQLNSTKIVKVAKRYNLNIELCMSTQQVKFENILMIANVKMKTTSDDIQVKIHNCTEKLNELAKETDDIAKNLNKIIGYCIRLNNLAWQQDKLTECLNNEIFHVHKKITELYQQKDVINSERITIPYNITTIQNNLIKRISKLHSEFIKCVSESDLHLNDSKESENVKVSDQEIIPQHGFPQQPINPTEQDFEKIYESFKKLEHLVDRLKEFHELGNIPNAETSSSFSNANEQFVTSNPMELKNNTMQLSEQNRRFIMYISF